MNLIYRIIILCLIAINTQAQPKPVKPITPNDPEAEKYLKLIKDKYTNLGTYKLTYKMQITDANNKSTSMSGTYISSGEKYIIEVDKKKTVSDGKTIWAIDSKEKEIQINKASTSKKNKVETPMDIIKQYNKLFKYRVKEPISNGTIVLELIPLDKNSPYFKIDLHIQTNKLILTASKLYDKGGNRVNFSISKTDELKADASLFTIKTENYKDFEVMDMR